MGRGAGWHELLLWHSGGARLVIRAIRSGPGHSLTRHAGAATWIRVRPQCELVRAALELRSLPFVPALAAICGSGPVQRNLGGEMAWTPQAAPAGTGRTLYEARLRLARHP